MNFKKLELFSSDIARQRSFYSEILNIEVMENGRDELRFFTGETELIFSEREGATPYHFAINIPSNQINDALTWLKKKGIEILCDGKNEIVDFVNWNAESVYFYDADKNIVELIARKNTGMISEKEFSAGNFLCLSEIGVPVENVPQTLQELNAIIPVPVYWGDDKFFCAAGDENGLFILVDRNRKKWFPVNDKVYSSDFKVVGDCTLIFKNGKFFAGS